MKWFSAIIIFAALGFISDKYLNSRPFTILFLILLIVPFVLLKSMMKYFTRKVAIQLDKDEISIDIKKLDNDEGKQNQTYKLFDIASYQIQFPNDRFVCLILKLKSGGKKEFSFRRQLLSDTQSNTDIVIETIHKTLELHGIELAPSFYASRKGLYTIVFSVVLLCFAFATAAYLDKNLPATIIGSMLLIGHIISRRMTDLDFYKKWKKV